MQTRKRAREWSRAKDRRTTPRLKWWDRSREGQQESQECPSKTDRLLRPEAYYSVADEVTGGPQNQP